MPALSPLEALAEALGEVAGRIERETRAATAECVATLQRETLRERELRDAQWALRLAEFNTMVASVTDLQRQVVERMAALKDGEPGASVSAADIAPMITASVEEAVAALPMPKDGRDADPDMVRQLIAAAVAEIPPAPPGRDADPEMIRGMIADAVSALPPAQPGRDADPDQVLAFVQMETQRILEGWDRPKDGTSVTVEDLWPRVETTIRDAVSALPPPKDGEPGRDVDMAVVEQRIHQRVDAILATWPPPRDGKDGTLPVARQWEDRVWYEGEVVTHEGATFQAVRDTGKTPGHEDWICLAERGSDGSDGRCFNPRGTYSEADVETYAALDVVALNGGSFYAKRDKPGPCPGEGWQLMASQGKPGKPGERMKGDPGSPGAKVESLSVDDNGLLRITNSDGSFAECDLYPLLSSL